MRTNLRRPLAGGETGLSSKGEIDVSPDTSASGGALHSKIKESIYTRIRKEKELDCKKEEVAMGRLSLPASHLHFADEDLQHVDGTQ
ncbi:hypothetical protein HAX54_004663, partial [Datura stramonium]|nr:hypothetical protein [Datura stramonium]